MPDLRNATVEELAEKVRISILYSDRMVALDELVRRAADTDRYRALAEYAAHTAWRCDYRTRYEECVCGLDDLMDELGLPRIPPNDPEARAALGGSE